MTACDGVQIGTREHIASAVGVDGAHRVRRDAVVLPSIEDQSAFRAQRDREAPRDAAQRICRS